MTTVLFTPEQVAEVSGLVANYIATQRRKYAPRAVHLTARQKATVGAFFAPELLAEARLLVLEDERVPNPDFYPMLRGAGLENLPDQTGMAAITFGDVVVSHEPFSDELLFHELVHIEQYRQLGIRRFANLYVRGFLNGGSYEDIQLEVNAYSLEDRFRRDRQHGFSVQREVAWWAAQEKL